MQKQQDKLFDTKRILLLIGLWLCCLLESFGQSTPPTLQSQYCNATDIHRQTVLYATPPTSGNPRYYFDIRGGNVNEVVERNNLRFPLSSVQSGDIEFGETYSIRVRTGNGSYGPSCSIKIEAHPTVEIEECNQEVLRLSSIRGGIHPNYRIQGYHFLITGPDNYRQEVIQSNRRLSLSRLPEKLLFNSTYTVQIATEIDGFISDYSTGCTIQTEAHPSTKIEECNTEILRLGNIFAEIIPNYSVQQYHFLITGPDNYRQEIVQRSRRLRLRYLPEQLVFNRSYNVAIATTIDGLTSEYGASCPIKTEEHPLTDIAQCNAAVLRLGNITANRVEGNYSVQQYHFLVTGPDNYRQEVVQRGSRLWLHRLPERLAFNTTYTVQIATTIDGLTSEYGQPCTITTEVQPSTKIQECNTEVLRQSSVTAERIPRYSVSLHHFLITGPDNYRQEVVQRGSRLWLHRLPERLAFNTTYTVQIATEIGGEISEFGEECSITTEAHPELQLRNCGTEQIVAFNTVLRTETPRDYQFTAYHFLITGSDGYREELTRPRSWFRVSELSAFLEYGVDYQVQVATTIEGVHRGEYSSGCPISLGTLEPALPMEWNMNSCDETIVLDQSGSGQNAIIEGANWNQGYNGEGMYFDGQNDRVYFEPDSPYLGPFSLSFYVKPNGIPTSGYETIFTSDDRVNNAGAFSIEITSNGHYQLRYRDFRNRARTIALGTAIDNEWSHIVLSGKNSVWELYQDEALIESITNVGAVYFSRYWLGSERNNRYFDGWIDELTFEGAYTAPSEIVKYAKENNSSFCPVAPENLISFFELNACKQTSIVDTEGTYQAKSIGAKYREGYNLQGLKFYGTDSYAVIEESNGLSLPDDFTIGLWFKAATQSSDAVLMSQGDISINTQGAYELSLRSNGRLQFSYRRTNRQLVNLVSTGLYSDTQWHYITLTKNGNVVSLYVDGKIQRSQNRAMEPVTDQALYLGVNQALANAYTGLMDEIILYDKVISPSDIYNLMGYPAEPLGCVPDPPTNLVATTAYNATIELTWEDNSDNETGFQIAYQKEGESIWSYIDVPANTTSFAHSGLEYLTSYCYEVRAVNKQLISTKSNGACAKTLGKYNSGREHVEGQKYAVVRREATSIYHQTNGNELYYRFEERYLPEGLIQCHLYNWKRELLGPLEMQKLYGVNRYRIELDREYEESDEKRYVWEENQYYTLEFEDENHIRFEFRFQYTNPKEAPETDLLAKAQSVTCEPMMASQIDYHAEIVGGTAPYQIRWIASEQADGNGLIQEQQEQADSRYNVLIDAESSLYSASKMTVLAPLGYYVTLEVEDACGNIVKQVAKTSCESPTLNSNFNFNMDIEETFVQPKSE